MRILSIQSHVAYGHAGNSAAVFPLQRLGHDVYPVLTVTFSNHTGYGATRGPLIAPDDVREVINGVEDRGAFPTIDAVLSGYQGAEAVGEVVLDAVARVKTANPAAVYCCDPVMGDVGRGFFVRPGIPEYLRDHVVPAADIVTPEPVRARVPHRPADDHAGRRRGGGGAAAPDGSVDGARHQRAHGRHPRGRDPDAVLVARGSWLVSTPLLPMTVRGGGDVTAAVFLAHTLTDGPRTALSRTAATMYAVLAATHAAGLEEMALIAEQDAIANPDERFAVATL